VDAGTLIARRKDFYVPLFASVSGIITAKVQRYNAVVGRPTAHYEITLDGKFTKAFTLKKLSFDTPKEQLVEAIKEAGLIGMGGAGFPTYVKYFNVKGIDTLIVNGVECEPYLSADYKLMELYPSDVVKGTELLRLASGAQKAVITVKLGKKALVDALTPYLNGYPLVSLMQVPDIYPMGWERALIKKVTGRDYDKLPSEAHVLVNNVTTARSAYQALIEGEPVTSRLVTFSGDALKTETNVNVIIGTPVNEIVAELGGYTTEEVNAFAGGPMSSKAVLDDTFVIQPSMGAFTVIKARKWDGVSCFRCGSCTASCPAKIQPIEIKLALDSDNTARLLKLDVMRCVECGLCSYVCPSRIEISEAVRKAKGKVRIAQAKLALLKK
jgi:electron transport complex protein RnfC